MRFTLRSVLRRAATPDARLARRYTKHYLNLSNGVEAIDRVLAAGVPTESLSFCRIQSSQCEAMDYVGLLDNIDTEMMVHLALGHECRIYDFGSRGSTWVTPDGVASSRYVPRAIWWGVEWWRYVLNSVWELPGRPPLLRGYNVEKQFRDALSALSKKDRKRIKFYRSFTADGLQEVQLRGFYAGATTDGDKEAHRLLLHALSRQLNERHEARALELEPEAWAQKVDMEYYNPRLMSGRNHWKRDRDGDGEEA